MRIVKNILLKGSHGKPIPTDIFYLHTEQAKPVVVYSHGFNGFKDWGNFDLIAEQFASAGFVFIKFNFSHNGTTPEHLDEFVDLEAYANNNYTTELDDLGVVIDWALSATQEHAGQIDKERLMLIGHSLGGGISILKAAEDARVKEVTTWASIHKCKTPWGGWPTDRIVEWKEKGVTYTTNSRTKQELPLNYQLYEDYQNNKERLNIQDALKKLDIPLLFCHGIDDTSVPVEKAYTLHRWHPSAELFLVPSDHVFGRKHPWAENHLPKAMQEVVEHTIEFFQHPE